MNFAQSESVNWNASFHSNDWHCLFGWKTHDWKMHSWVTWHPVNIFYVPEWFQQIDESAAERIAHETAVSNTRTWTISKCFKLCFCFSNLGLGWLRVMHFSAALWNCHFDEFEELQQFPKCTEAKLLYEHKCTLTAFSAVRQKPTSFGEGWPINKWVLTQGVLLIKSICVCWVLGTGIQTTVGFVLDMWITYLCWNQSEPRWKFNNEQLSNFQLSSLDFYHCPR